MRPFISLGLSAKPPESPPEGSGCSRSVFRFFLGGGVGKDLFIYYL